MPENSQSLSLSQSQSKTPRSVLFEELLQQIESGIERLNVRTPSRNVIVENGTQRVLRSLASSRSALSKVENLAVAFLGDTGVGKSTLINAMLEAELLPTSSIRICTSGITRITNSDIDGYKIQVEYKSSEEWQSFVEFVDVVRRNALEDQKALETEALGEVQESDTPDKGEDLPHALKVDQTDRLIAVYGNETESFEGVFDFDQLQIPLELAGLMQNGVSHHHFLSVSECQDALAQLIAVPKARELREMRSRQSVTKGGQPWPLVKAVSIQGRFPGIPFSVDLVDLPGLNDPSPDRELTTKNFLLNAAMIVTVLPANRGVTKSTKDVLTSDAIVGNLALSSGSRAFCFVVTKADDLDTDQTEAEATANGISIEIAREQAFIQRIDELWEEASEKQSAIADELASHSTKDHQALAKHDLIAKAPVIVMAAETFLKLKVRDLKPETRAKLKTRDVTRTGIPTILEQLGVMYESVGPDYAVKREIIRTIDSLDQLRIDINNLLLSNNVGLKSSAFKQFSQFVRGRQEDLDDLLEGFDPGRYLRQSVKNLVDRLTGSRSDSVVNDIVESFSRTIRTGAMHGNTLRATVYRGGVWSGSSSGPKDLYANASRPIAQALQDELMSQYSQVVQNFEESFAILDEYFESFISESVNVLPGMTPDAEVIARILQVLQESRRSVAKATEFASSQLKNLFDQLLERIPREIELSIQQAMKPAIEAARLVRSAGSAAKMRELLEGGMWETADTVLAATTGILEVEFEKFERQFEAVTHESSKNFSETFTGFERLFVSQPLDEDVLLDLQSMANEIQDWLESCEGLITR